MIVPEGTDLPPIPGIDPNNLEFYVLDAGDISTDTAGGGNYPYLVCTDPIGLNLIVVARDPAVFDSTYKNKVLREVKNEGFFLPANKPQKTFQSETECNYPTVSQNLHSGLLPGVSTPA